MVQELRQGPTAMVAHAAASSLRMAFRPTTKRRSTCSSHIRIPWSSCCGIFAASTLLLMETPWPVDLTSDRPDRAVAMRIAYELIIYFENGRTGPVVNPDG